MYGLTKVYRVPDGAILEAGLVVSTPKQGGT